MTKKEIDLQQLLLIAINASLRAGDAIMEVYGSEDFQIEAKADNSPLTLADKMSNAHIEKALQSTGLPILSEEGKDIPYEERKQWEHFWLIDPLDGTKEFVKRNGEFTVNIALIYRKRPVLGVIYAPVHKLLYFASEDFGSYRLHAKDAPQGLSFPNLNDLSAISERLPLPIAKRRFTVVASRSHMSPETMSYVEKLRDMHGSITFASTGSSLKICLVAEGTADIYPRFAPTMEWDTAAGQAIAELAGRSVVDYSTDEPLEYNKEELRNSWFIVSSDNDRFFSR
jgi:3'(2'), 5'-bisphosphate nucleotidase